MSMETQRDFTGTAKTALGKCLEKKTSINQLFDFRAILSGHVVKIIHVFPEGSRTVTKRLNVIVNT